jgi:hypothetical protein
MKDGKKRAMRLKSTGEEKVQGQAQNTKTVIGSVRDKILSETWTDLTEKVDELLDTVTNSPSRRRSQQTDRTRQGKAEGAAGEPAQEVVAAELEPLIPAASNSETGS